MVWLSTIAFATNSNMDVLQTVASFFAIPDMAQISPPVMNVFRLSEGAHVKQRELRLIIKSAVRPFHSCPEANLPRHSAESDRTFQDRKHREFQKNQNQALDRLVNAL